MNIITIILAGIDALLKWYSSIIYIEIFYLNTIEQLFLFVELLYQLELCLLGHMLPYSRLLTGIPILVFQNLRWNSNKTSLMFNCITLFNIDPFQDVIHELAKKLGYRSRDIGETWLTDKGANGVPDLLRNGAISAF